MLLENPMTGYMNDIIFTRILGHEEIEEGSYWVDAVQCWVCNKWNKVIFSFHEDKDKAIFQQKLSNIENLQQKIHSCVEQGIEKSRAANKADEFDRDIESIMIDDHKSEHSSIIEAPEADEGGLEITGSIKKQR